jgi:hypothetical protein
MTKRLRIQHLIVQPVLLWDDDETGELSPGPELGPLALPLSQVEAFVSGLPAEVAALAVKLSEADPA